MKQRAEDLMLVHSAVLALFTNHCALSTVVCVTAALQNMTTIVHGFLIALVCTFNFPALFNSFCIHTYPLLL